MQPTPMSSKDASTMAQIYQHPAAHNLEWHDVVALIEHLGSVDTKDNSHMTFTVNGLSQGFHRPQGKDVSDVQQILDLRRFLEGSGYGKKVAAVETELRLLVVINQKETRVFRTENQGSIPTWLEPYDPQDNLRHLKHTEGADRDAKAPENLAYYKVIAETLTGADEILLMGNGTGSSSAMGHLQDFLAMHHKPVADRIVGALTVDIEALSDDEMLEKARAFYALRDEGK